MTGDQGDEPEDTMPFTHRPYGSDEAENPFTSPSGPASQPSGPGYVPPPASLPPMASPPPLANQPYGPPQPGQVPDPSTPWGAAWTPAYGPGMPGPQEHQGAKQAMFLGIVALVCLGIALFCCLTIPGLVCAPVAWVKGARAKREIDAMPGVYSNRGQAVAGIVMGIIGCGVGALVIAGFVGLAILIGSGWSLV